MAKIEGFNVRNFRALRDLTIGTLDHGEGRTLTPLTAVIGKNGVGKSSLFDAFGFLADCLRLGVEEACDVRGRGGFERIRSQGQEGPIRVGVRYRQTPEEMPTFYGFLLDLDGGHRPRVAREVLAEWDSARESYYTFLDLENGEGAAWKGLQSGAWIDFNRIDDQSLRRIGPIVFDPEQMDEIDLGDPRRLGIATLGALKQHPRIAAFRDFIEGWYLSYFTPEAARTLPLAGPQRHLNSQGDNLGNVVQFMEREHPERFHAILERIACKIPGIDRIGCERTIDDRLVLRFNDKGFVDPFYAQQMSDGTLKLFAYLLLLEDPTPPSFICIEEPENGLYHKLLETLAYEFRQHATAPAGGSQIFVTTHQPYLVNALEPEEVWVLEKGTDGFATIRRASDDPVVAAMAAEGLPLGSLWYSDYLDAR